MKKLVLVLLVAMLSVPAFAAVDPNITIGVVGTTVTVGYTADSADLISGMGLTVQLSSGTIGSFTDLQGDTGKYNIHPCSIVIDGSVVTDYNTPIYSGGNGGTSVVVEYGALYVGDANAPATAGNLFSFDVVGGTSPVTVTVSANHAGGIVTEALVQSNIIRTKNVVTAAPAPTIATIAVSSANPGTTATFTNIAGTNFAAGATVQLTKTGQAPIAVTTAFVSATQLTGSVALPLLTQQGTWNVVVTVGTQSATLANGFTVNSCFAQGAVGSAQRLAYDKWVDYGMPSCWCFKKHCRGDADGILTYTKPVMVPDLTIFKSGYNKSKDQVKAIPGAICADFDKLDTYTKPVMVPDLTIFKNYYNDTAATVPQCDAVPVPTNNAVSFWTN